MKRLSEAIDVDIRAGVDIKRRRGDLEITQKHLALLTGLQQENIGQLERGRPLTPYMRHRLETAFCQVESVFRLITDGQASESLAKLQTQLRAAREAARAAMLRTIVLKLLIKKARR